MKITKTTCLIVVACLLAFTACQQITDAVNEQLQGSIQTGTWSDDGKTFTNDWSNLSLTLPDGFFALSSEEIEATVGAGNDVIVNNSDLKQSEIDASKLRTAYDFMVTADLGIPNAFLMYENIGMQPLLKNLDEAGYFESAKKQLEAIEEMEYAAAGTSTMKIANEDWYVGTMSISDGMAYQDYCVKKIDDVFVVLCVTYTDDTKEQSDAFVASIKQAN